MKPQHRKSFRPSGFFVILVAVGFQFVAPLSITAEESRGVRESTWNGFRRENFQIAEREAYLVEPKAPLPGRPWIWRARFPGYHAEMDIELVKRGFHLAHVDVAGLFGSPQAINIGNQLYKYLVEQHELSTKVVLEGVSRGGLVVYNWAAQHPDKVACIYCDTPVCDVKSWPGGQGSGRGSKSDWARCLQVYQQTPQTADKIVVPIDDEPANVIGKAKIPILHVVSHNDVIVPPEENSFRLRDQLERFGHTMEFIHVAKGTEKSSGHHFQHPNPQRVVDFVVRHAATPSTVIEGRQQLLRDARRIVFLGDSITFGGTYVAYFDCWLTQQEWPNTPEVINMGLSSETVSGLSEDGHAGGRFPRPDLFERLDRVLNTAKPDLVVACYGINCGIYQPFSKERFDRYQEGIRRLRSMVEMSNAKIVFVTPPTYDDARGKKDFSYESVMQKYASWLLSQQAQGWNVVDLHGPMIRELQRRRTKDETFTFQPDSVHPNLDGHQFMAGQLIGWFGGDPTTVVQGDLLSLITARMQVLRNAYVSKAGHKRPGVRPGLPLREAKAKAAELTSLIKQKLTD